MMDEYMFKSFSFILKSTLYFFSLSVNTVYYLQNSVLMTFYWWDFLYYIIYKHVFIS